MSEETVRPGAARPEDQHRYRADPADLGVLEAAKLLRSGRLSAVELTDHEYGREVVAVQPKVLMSGETARIVLPGEPGYE